MVGLNGPLRHCPWEDCREPGGVSEFTVLHRRGSGGVGSTRGPRRHSSYLPGPRGVIVT